MDARHSKGRIPLEGSRPVFRHTHTFKCLPEVHAAQLLAARHFIHPDSLHGLVGHCTISKPLDLRRYVVETVHLARCSLDTTLRVPGLPKVSRLEPLTGKAEAQHDEDGAHRLFHPCHKSL